MIDGVPTLCQSLYQVLGMQRTKTEPFPFRSSESSREARPTINLMQ